jgi:thiaminase/transcriptional activator TenA
VSAGLSEELWAENSDLAYVALAHPFVRGLGDGSLPAGLFRGYVGQDAFFLESFARAYAMALTRSHGTETLKTLSGLIAGVVEELELHASFAASLGIDLAAIEPAPATLAYTEFLHETSSTGSVGETFAAMTPCLRLYAWLGLQLDAQSAGPYAQWVQTYADPGFHSLAGRLEQLVDSHVVGEDAAVHRVYRQAMTLEIAFFDAALTA